MKVLLIEDDKQCADMIQRALHGLTSRVDVTDKLSEGLRLLCDDYDAVWLDLSLTDSRSEDTLRAIPSIRDKCPNVTLLVVSGYGDKYHNEAIEMGADAYASKIDLEGFRNSAVVNLLVRAATHAMERGVNSSFILERVATFIQN